MTVQVIRNQANLLVEQVERSLGSGDLMAKFFAALFTLCMLGRSSMQVGYIVVLQCPMERLLTNDALERSTMVEFAFLVKLVWVF